MNPVRRARRAEPVQRWRSLLRCCAAGAVVYPALFLAVSFVPGIAAAEGISGYVELGYADSTSDAHDNLGNSSHTDSISYAQRYNLSLSKTLYPYLKLYANGLFDKLDSKTDTNGTETDATLTRVQPMVDLTLRSPVYTAGARYNRREETSTSSVGPRTTLIGDLYTGILGLYPPAREIPSVELRVERAHVYDRAHSTTDVDSDKATLTVNYTPTDTITMQYRPVYNDSTNHLSTLETQNMTQNGRVEYADNFFKNRVTIDTSYIFTSNKLTTSVSGTGTLDISLVLFSGLSDISDTPTRDTLFTNQALIDANLTAPAGVNIGMPSIIGGDTRQRNIGVDFSLAQDVNMLRLWVDRELPAAISGSFSWDIYTSTDNQTWNLYTTVFPAPFGQFDNRFEITFPTVHTRYIKVVVKPLSTAVQGASGFPDIFVTEIQAFSRKTAEQARGQSTSSNQVYSFDGRALLLESANLYYNLSYFFTKQEPSSEQRWTLSNMLTANHQFNRVFSGNARAGREDFVEPANTGYAYVASTSLDAVPLKTLRHNLSYSGRFEEGTAGHSDSNTIFLNNYVAVYQGVDLTVGGGVTVKNQAPDSHLESTDVIGTAGIQPHRTLNLSFNMDLTRQQNSGGGQPVTTTSTRITGAAATYHPVETLYLVAGISTVVNVGTTRRTKNYAFNWSPFSGGDLQFAFAYSESLESEQNSRSTIYTPSLTWRIARTTFLTAAYQATHGTSEAGGSDSKIFSTTLRANF